MRFALSEDQALLQRSTREFFATEFPMEHNRRVMEHEPLGFERAAWSHIAEMGYLGLTVPSAKGGQGLGAVELAVVLEEAGRQCVPGPLLDVMLAASLLATGEIFGWRPPIDVPAWASILGLIAAYAVVAAPLRAVRYASYEALGPRRTWFVFWDGVLWLTLVVLGFWLVTRFVPGVSELFQDLIHGWRDIPFDIAALVGVR